MLSTKLSSKFESTVGEMKLAICLFVWFSLFLDTKYALESILFRLMNASVEVIIFSEVFPLCGMYLNAVNPFGL